MRAPISSVAALLLTLGLAERSAAQATTTATPPSQQPQATQPAAPLQQRQPDFDRMLQQQVETDKTWRAGDMEIPYWVFQPLKTRGPKLHPALVWTHENIRGHLYEHYIPYIREATARGYVVIAPEYRGSIGYGREHYDAIDYGGKEVDDVVTAVDILKEKYPAVDPDRIGIIGWSHGGMISLLSTTRNPA